MKYVGAIRKELGIRTVFNILGPITNPASPDYVLLGVYDEYLLDIITGVLINLGVKDGLVVYGTDVLDEVSVSAPTKVSEFHGTEVKTYEIAPEDFGITRGEKSDILGGTPAENAQTTRDILSGKITGPKRDIVLMNAGCGLYIGHQADSIADGVKKAVQLIDSGAALAKLDAFIEQSNA